MPQLKISLDATDLEFVNSHAQYGIDSKAGLVRLAIANLRKQLVAEAISKSSELYQEIYESDRDLQELTETGTSSCLD